MTRNRPRQPPQGPTRPLDAAMLADEQQLANELAGLLEALKGYELGDIKGVVHLKPNNGQGPWQWCDDVYPPFDLTEIMTDMKDRFGPGFYEMRIYAKGQIRKNVPFVVAKEKGSQTPPAVTTSAGNNNLNELFVMMMQQQQAAADRQMQMMASMSRQTTDTLAAILPALARPAAPGTSAAEIAALVTALKPDGSGGGLAETLKAMAAMKELLGDRGGGDDDGGVSLDPNDLVASGARLVGPALKALGDLVNRPREAAPGGPSASLPAPQGGGDQLALGPPGTVSRFRLIELVKVDVSYFFQRGHDPAKAAECVYDIIEANNVTDAEIDQLAATFALSPTGLDDLAAEGIDLRGNPAWAAAFFAELHAIHTGAEDDSDGGDGGAPDAGGNGAASAPGH